MYKVICICSASMYSKCTILQADIGQKPMNRCSCFPKDFYENLIFSAFSSPCRFCFEWLCYDALCFYAKYPALSSPGGPISFCCEKSLFAWRHPTGTWPLPRPLLWREVPAQAELCFPVSLKLQQFPQHRPSSPWHGSTLPCLRISSSLPVWRNVSQVTSGRWDWLEIYIPGQ